MRRRAGTGLMDGLWEFPPLPAGRARATRDDALRLRSLGRLATVRHTITYRRIVVEVHRARLISEPRGNRYRWVAPSETRRLPTSSLVPKILMRLHPAGRSGA